MPPSVHGKTDSLPAKVYSGGLTGEEAGQARVKRIPSFRTLDALRGFAALWVVMDHSCDRFLGGANPVYTHQPLYAFAIRGGLGVVLFFVISGYCITAAAHGALYSGKKLSRYWFERGRRIFPPYWTALILGMVAQLALRIAESHHWIPKVNHPKSIALVSSPIYWIANFTLTQTEFNTDFANIVFWSLCYEVAFYVVVGACLFGAQRLARIRGIAFGQLTLILALATTTLASLLALIVFDGSVFPFELWPQFAVGGLLFYVIDSSPETIAGYSTGLRRILNGVAAATLVALGLYAWLRPGDNSDIGHPPNAIRTSLCLLFCLLLAGIRRYDAQIAGSIWVRPMLWLGACSYSLYLIHPVVLPFVDVACRRAGLDGPRYWITFWIEVTVAIVFGRLFYVLVERHFVSSRQTNRLIEEKAA